MKKTLDFISRIKNITWGLIFTLTLSIISILSYFYLYIDYPIWSNLFLSIGTGLLTSFLISLYFTIYNASNDYAIQLKKEINFMFEKNTNLQSKFLNEIYEFQKDKLLCDMVMRTDMINYIIPPILNFAYGDCCKIILKEKEKINKYINEYNRNNLNYSIPCLVSNFHKISDTLLIIQERFVQDFGGKKREAIGHFTCFVAGETPKLYPKAKVPNPFID